MNAKLRSQRRTETLVATAALLRALARAFAMPAPGHLDGLRRMFATLPAGTAPPRSELGRRLNSALRALRGVEDEAWATEYLRRFAGSGPVRLHETAYGDGRRFAGRENELADLNGFYRAFGLQLAPTDPDLPDHLSVELEFLSLLRLKQSYALARHDRAAARITADAARLFLEQHLGRWIGALMDAMTEAAVPSPFRELAMLVEALVVAECRAERIYPQPFSGLMPVDDMQGESFSCPLEAQPATGG